MMPWPARVALFKIAHFTLWELRLARRSRGLWHFHRTPRASLAFSVCDYCHRFSHSIGER